MSMELGVNANRCTLYNVAGEIFGDKVGPDTKVIQVPISPENPHAVG